MSSFVLVFLVLAQVALPFSRGFVVASGGGGGTHHAVISINSNNPLGLNNNNNKRRSSSTLSQVQLHPPKPPTTSSARFAASVSSSASTTAGQQHHKSPSSTNDDDQPSWKGGEQKASFISRLLFNYVNPVIKTASQRRLEAKDAFDVPVDRQMDKAVTSLQRIYKHVRTKSQKRRIEKQHKQKHKKQQQADNSNTNESLILTEALVLHQRRILIKTACLRLISTAVQAFPAILVARLLKLVEAGNAQHPAKALTTAVTLVLVLSVKMIIENQLFHDIIKCSTQVRGALAGLIFDKSLHLPSGGSSITQGSSATDGATEGNVEQQDEQSLGVGGVLNLMQSDTGIIEFAAMQIHTIWDGPLQIAIYTTLLYKYLGPSIFWGIGVLLLTIPVNSLTLRLLNKLSKFENEAKDARTARTAESINSMKLLKLQGWEDEFANDIRKSRRDELRRHVTRGIIRALNTAFSNAVPALVLVVTLTAYVKTGKPLVASTIFTAISLFNQLRFPLFFYPMLIDSLANGKNAMKRIANFLSAEEIVPYVQHVPLTDGQGGGSIEMKHGNFLWTKNTKKNANPAATTETSLTNTNKNTAPALINAELKVNPGEIVAVVGGVGSGKSALIKALLGELNPAPYAIVEQAISPELTDSMSETDILTQPSVVTTGNVAYCSQEAWLPKGTIRDAIAFGREYDEDRYLAAIRDAGLDKDISGDVNGVDAGAAAVEEGQLSHGTDVGEGGSSLSGGQRARVALARALYAGEDTKVFLLDDCLAALDASVGLTVFDRLSKRFRGTKAAVVLVTNDQNIPRRCDRVILMGKVPSSPSCSAIKDIGTYNELISRGHDIHPTGPVHDDHTIQNIDYGGVSSFAETTHGSDIRSSDDVTSEKLTKVAKKTLRVAGGYEAPLNCTEASCHADPECQVGMSTCPDYLSDHVFPISPDVKDAEIILHGEPSLSNDTVISSTSVTHTIPDVSAAASVQLETKAESTGTDAEKLPKKLASADEAMSTGAVPWSTYVLYFKAVRQPLLIVGMIASFLMATGAQFFQQFTVAKWTELGQGSAMAAALGAKYMKSLVNAAVVVSVFLWLRSFLTMAVCVRASEFLHSRMLNSVFASPMSFFSATPSGQLLSRFGKEMETVDRGVPDSIGSVLFCFLQIFMSIAALASVVTPAMLAPLLIVGRLYIKAMSMFRPAARDMKRAETKTRSPIYTHFGEALRGTETIRSIPGSSKLWSSTHRKLSDNNLAVFYTVKFFDRWLSTRLETLGNVVVFTAAVASVSLTRIGRLKAGSAGWGLTQALSITGLLTWAVRCLTDLETNMMSVMRVKELTDLDSEEPDLRSLKSESKSTRRMPKEVSEAGDSLKPLFADGTSFNATLAPLNSSALAADGWPWCGNVLFRNVSMRYNPTAPLVLDRVTLSVPPGTTLGIVGRTGSGKSSLLLTLFRLVEIEAGGSIEIDSVDIRSVALKTLRQSLAIIPQDPVLFAGTVAYNLDATGKASSDAMWSALEAAAPSLAQQFRDAEGLESKITEGGKNLSLGQRQLICLARALLRNSKILVLDEATSSVDVKTDQEVQQTIRREFVAKGATVITVAHRLDTVLGYDKIAVLGNGKVLEYGSPNDLLKSGGELRRLVEADRKSKRKGGSSKSEQDAALVSA